jgi:hypothetical protein
MFKTALRNKKLYITTSDFSWDKPEIITSFWPCQAPGYPEYNNQPVYELGQNGKYIRVFDRDIPVNPLTEYPEFNEITPIKPPSKRYRWHNGEWIK